MFSKLLPWLRCVVAGVLSLAATASLAQKTVDVGAGQAYSTIQSGINAAVDGDTVLVGPGTYYENINFNNKGITVTSSGGAPVTIIDGGSRRGSPTVSLSYESKSATVLSKFTIRGGGNSIFSGKGDGGVYVGGNFYAQNPVAPVIRDNIITGNYCHNIDIEFAVVAILNNEVSNVLQDRQGTQGNTYCSFGSGINLQGTQDYYSPGTSVIGNTIENNLTGSAINLWAAQNVLIMNNTIRNNVSPDPGSALISANSVGTVFVQNLVYGNTSTCGGAIAPEDGGLTAATPSILIANNTMVDNVTPSSSGGSECTRISQIYPGPYSYGSSGPGMVVLNNVISGSTPYPAVNCDWFNKPNLNDQPTFQNNILFNGGGPFFGSYCVDVSTQNNNLTGNPQFVSPSTGDYHLKSTSPGIDTGQNSVLQTFLAMTGRNLTADFDGNPRVQNATGSGCTIDMGAFESPGTISTCGTTETLQSSLNPSTYGLTVTFTAQLSSSAGAPTGTVQFNDGTTALSVQPISSSGASSYTTSALTVGTHSITAIYQPVGNFSAATAALSQVVNGSATSSNLVSSSNPSPVGQSITFTDTVNYSQTIQGANTGSVTFFDGGTALQTVSLRTVSAGSNVPYTASYATTSLSVGTHAITATLNPPNGFSPSSSSVSQVVSALASSSVLVATPATAPVGSPFTLSAKVAAAVGSATAPVPTGSVTFLVDGTSAASPVPVAGGNATLSVASLAGGRQSFSCRYSGDTIYAPSACNDVPVTVNAIATSMTVVSSANPSVALTPVTFTAQLSTGNQAQAGNKILLSIGSGVAVPLVTDATGKASYNTSGLTPGSYTVMGAFQATNSLLASTAALTQVVTSSPTGTTLGVAPSPGYQGQIVSITASVTALNGVVPGGLVTFFDAGVPIGTATLNPSGQAPLNTTSLTPGTHPLTAAYGATTSFSASTSPVVNEVILTSGFTIALSPGSIILPPGATGSAVVQLNSMGNFSGPLTLDYGTLPTYATASMNGPVVTLSAGGSGSSTLTLKTLLKAANELPPRPGFNERSILCATALLCFLPLGLLRRNRLTRLLSVAVLFITLQAVTGCSNTWYSANAVAVGTYQVAITATDVNHNRQTAVLTVTVTP